MAGVRQTWKKRNFGMYQRRRSEGSFVWYRRVSDPLTGERKPGSTDVSTEPKALQVIQKRMEEGNFRITGEAPIPFSLTP
jgi:hypothetical protein